MPLGGTIRVSPLGVLLLVTLVLLVAYLNLPGAHTSVRSSSAAEKNPELVSMKQLLAVAIEVAKRGGREVKAVRESIDLGEESKGKTAEGANNPVTAGDMNSHRAMYNGVLKAFPGLSVVSEEDDPHPVDPTTIQELPEFDEEVERVVGTRDVLIPKEDIDVWIDPLDATQEYTENLRHYVTTMVCVAVKGRPVVGVIHKPFDDLTVWGWAGPNHVNPTLAKDVKNNRVKEHRDLAKSRLIVSRSHAGHVHEVAAAAFGPEAEVTPAGGAGFKTWEVVRGAQDAYVHVTLIKKWDICAGAAILKALGGRLSALSGEEIDYSGRGPNKSERNEGGVLATMHDHEAYVKALKDEAPNVKKYNKKT